jgi:hypothetical protein
MMRVLIKFTAVVLLMAGSAAVVYYFAYHQPEQKKREYHYHFTVLFKDVWALYQEAAVRVQGKTIGEVENIRLWQQWAAVDIRAKESFPIYKDYQVISHHRNMMGGYYIELKPGSPAAGKIHDHLGGVVLMGQAIGEPITVGSKLLAQNRKVLYNITKNLQKITESVLKRKGTLGRMALADDIHERVLALLRESKKLVDDYQRYQELDNIDERRGNWARGVTSFGNKAMGQ